jgi:hypothetical protein
MKFLWFICGMLFGIVIETMLLIFWFARVVIA